MSARPPTVRRGDRGADVEQDRQQGFARVSDREFAAGWVPGHDLANARLEAHRVPSDPILALERALLPALTTPPCVIGFSGGRDSSAILAVAVQLARREGLEVPIPVTKVYPDVPASDESAWQEMVIRWVGVDDWIREEFTDELDLLSPQSLRSVQQHGLLWPASVHNREPAIRIAKGGWYVDGEGGDEILGEFRITPVTRLLRGERPFGRRAVRDVARTFAPAVLRRSVAAYRARGATSDRVWLRPDVQAWYERTSRADAARVPLTYPRALQHTLTRRAVRVAMTNLDVMGRALDVRYLHPLFDPGFLAALSRAGGRLGFTSRTATMRAVFGDLLPDAVNARDSKVYFNGPFFGRYSRDFVSRWDGTGLDPELVDADALREVWQEPFVHAGTFQLLHAAWLASGTGSEPQRAVEG